MSGTSRSFRVLKKKSDGIIYVAVPDLLEYFRQLKEKGSTITINQLMEDCIDDFRQMVIERIEE